MHMHSSPCQLFLSCEWYWKKVLIAMFIYKYDPWSFAFQTPRDKYLSIIILWEKKVWLKVTNAIDTISETIMFNSISLTHPIDKKINCFASIPKLKKLLNYKLNWASCESCRVYTNVFVMKIKKIFSNNFLKYLVKVKKCLKVKKKKT